jgi:antitoxin YefM
MPEFTTYRQARETLAALCNQVAATREPVIIRRPNAEDVALIAAGELEGLLETAHLLRSPKNAQRLMAALQRAQEESVPTSSPGELRSEFGLGKKSGD